MNLVPPPPLNIRSSENESPSSRAAGVIRRSPVREALSTDRHKASLPRKPAALQLGHVHLKVRCLERSIPFYMELLGFRLTERTGRYAFLALADEHHSIALEEIGNWSEQPSRRAVGVAHIAFEAPNREAFAAMRRRLVNANLPFISRNNGISWTLRFNDPDGNEIEVYVDRRRSSGGSRYWEGRWYQPHLDAAA